MANITTNKVEPQNCKTATQHRWGLIFLIYKKIKKRILLKNELEKTEFTVIKGKWLLNMKRY